MARFGFAESRLPLSAGPYRETSMALDDIRIVLIEPRHPGNIGAVARAMKTMSLSSLYLVRPYEFPSYEAVRRAAGADDILREARTVEDLGEAIGDCRLVVGCSARTRAVPHALLDPRQCSARLVAETAGGEPAALLFGPERTGLENHDLERCNFQLLIPANEKFSSLNLAAAAQLVCYEIFAAARELTLEAPRPVEELPVCEQDMEYFFQHLVRALDSRSFLKESLRERALMKLRRLLEKTRPNSSELKMLHSLTRLIHKDGA